MSTTDSSTQWRVAISDRWDILGPFPIHAREQHYLSPSFPLDLSIPVDYSQSWPSSYADGGLVSWSTASLASDGLLMVSFPNIRWQSLRATEGWAALQHHAVLHAKLTLYPPHKQPSAGTLPRITSTPQWFTGNIYDMERAIPRTFDLPSPPSLSEPTSYDVFVSGDYEIRLFGDPVVRGVELPVQNLRFVVEIENPLPEIPVTHEPLLDVACDFVQGYAFGSTLGIGVRSISGWWNITQVEALDTQALSLSLQKDITLAPTQTRILPILLSQTAPFRQSQLRIQLTMNSTQHLHRLFVIALPIRHLSQWTSTTYTTIRATYLYAASTPTIFVVIPPVYGVSHHSQNRNPILALHGAGVDVVNQSFWPEALPRRKYNWIVLPSGLTSWGLDWHGPSAQDAFASVSALSSILNDNAQWKPWSFDPNLKVLTMGHSNGGHGAIYLASRYPDKVIGGCREQVVAAAGYIKSQAYVPHTMSRSAHYIDPALRSILESSLSPDDNDLHLCNLADMPVLLVHGANDDNVPVWHSREVMSIIKSLQPGANVKLREDVGQAHWYSSVFNNEQVQDFIDVTLSNTQQSKPKDFTLTVSSPAECGSLHGWRIDRLILPGRLAHLRVQVDNLGAVKVVTSNVLSFSLDRRHYDCTEIQIGESVTFRTSLLRDFVSFENTDRGTWKIVTENVGGMPPPCRVQAILTSPDTLIFVVPNASLHQELSLALRLSHDLLIHHRLDIQILTESGALNLLETSAFPSTNVIVIGRPSSRFARAILGNQETSFGLTESGLSLSGRSLSDPDLGVIFLHPHPSKGQRDRAVALFLLGNSANALERIARLFPIRTGVPTPSWVVTGPLVDALGAAGIRGAGIWTGQWSCNDASSMWLF